MNEFQMDIENLQKQQQVILIPASNNNALNNAIVVSNQQPEVNGKIIAIRPNTQIQPVETDSRVITIRPNTQIQQPIQYVAPQQIYQSAPPPPQYPETQLVAVQQPMPLQSFPMAGNMPQMPFNNGFVSNSVMTNSSMFSNNQMGMNGMNMANNSLGQFDTRGSKSSLSLHDISLRSKSQAAYNNQHSLSSLANKNNKLSTVDDENVPVGKVEPNDTHQKVSIADSKGKVMIDNLVNELKMPVEVSEDKIEEKKIFTEKQKYLGFTEKKFKIILITLGVVGVVAGICFAVCLALLITDSGTDYEWKIFGSVLTGATFLFCVLALVFILVYTHYKYNKYKELLDQEIEGTDEEGNQVQVAGIKKIYKYSKPGMPDKLPGIDAKTPAPTFSPTRLMHPLNSNSQFLPPNSRMVRVVKVPSRNMVDSRGQVVSPSSLNLIPVNDPSLNQITTTTPMRIAAPQLASQPTGFFNRIIRYIKPQPKTLKVIPVNQFSSQDPEIVSNTIRATPRIIRIKKSDLADISVLAKEDEQNGSSLSTSHLIKKTQSAKSVKKPVILIKDIGEQKNVFKN